VARYGDSIRGYEDSVRGAGGVYELVEGGVCELGELVSAGHVIGGGVQNLCRKVRMEWEWEVKMMWHQD
jgi:hypothetical protein